MSSQSASRESSMQAMTLIRAGATYEEIARAMEVSPSEAKGFVEDYLASEYPNVPTGVALEHDRLAAISRTVWRDAMVEKNPSSISLVASIAKSREKMFQKYSPKTRPVETHTPRPTQTERSHEPSPMERFMLYAMQNQGNQLRSGSEET